MTKDEFVSELTEEGYSAGYANNGVPTVFVDSADKISITAKSLKKLVKVNGYTESYGISLSVQKGTSL